MSRYGIAFVLLLPLIACSTLFPTSTPTPVAAWQDMVDGMAALTRGLQFPDHFAQEDAQRTGTEFDVNDYFAALTHLSPETGYVLDYVYYYDMMGGRPIIYARLESQAPYATFSEYADTVGDDFFAAFQSDYLEHIQVDGTAEGYFELVVLAIQAEQFYLYWHASYNDSTVVCDSEAVEAVIEAANDFAGLSVPTGVEREALLIDLEPQVVLEEGVAQVRIVTFTKWGGFFEEIFTISQDFPHSILDHERKELVPYECGVMF